MDEFWGSAIKFVPSDEHIVKLVQERALGRQLPAVLLNRIRIRDVDVFGKLNPEEIYTQSEPFHQKERYCFTLLKRKGKGQRFARTTGGGTWKFQFKKFIVDKIAVRSYFSYQPAVENDDQDCSWGLYVYSLVSPSTEQYQDYAVCKILRTRELIKPVRDVDVQDQQCKLPTTDCTSVPCNDTFSMEHNDNLDYSFEQQPDCSLEEYHWESRKRARDVEVQDQQCKLQTTDCTSFPCNDTFCSEYNDNFSFEQLLNCSSEEFQGLVGNFYRMDEHGCSTLDVAESTTTCTDHMRQYNFNTNNDENEVRDVTYEEYLFDHQQQ